MCNHSRNLKLVCISVFVMMFFNFSFATQIKIIHDNDTAQALVSTQGLTRIAVSHDRIINVRGPEGAYHIKNDNVQGAVFLQPTRNTKPFTVFVATEQNHNYILHLMPTIQHADTILIQSSDQNVLKSVHRGKASSYNQAITQLMNAMVNHRHLEDYSIQLIPNQENYYSNIATFTLVQIYSGEYLQGEVYRVKNCTNHTVTLRENGFYQLNDRAIALKNPIVKPQGETWLYKITGSEVNDE